MKKLFDQHFLSRLLFLLASALLMPMGAWGQTLVFGTWSTSQEFVEKSAETVNWRDRVYTLPGLYFKINDGYEEAGTATYSSSNESVATVDEKGTVTFVAYEGTATITATYINATTGAGGSASSLTATFAITINDDRAEFGGMGVQFSESSATATYGQSFTPPTVSTGQFEKLALAYSSSNTNVATVDETSGDVTIVGVGETTISAAYAGDDYVKPGSISYTLTVNPATVTVSGITASNKEYDGTTTATLSYSSATIQDANGDPVSGVSVSGATGTFADANVGQKKTVTISGITLSSANYTVASTGSQTSTTADITVRTAALSWSATEFTYDGQTHAPTATVSNLVSGDACTVTVTGGASSVGTHTATATALSNSNYSLPASATTSFTINAAAMTGVSATGYTGTYDGAAHGISVTAPEGATVTYGESANACTAAASPTLTNVGEKTVYYKVSKTGYTDVTGSQVVKITAREATLNWSNLTFTYDGQTHVPTATVSNLVGQDACTVTVSGAASAVGTHTATATALSNSNYSLPASATTSFTISAAAMTGVSATGYTGTYDGAAHGISVTAPEGATVTYGESADACTAAVSPTYSEAGEYTVYYRVSMTGYNDYTGSAIVSISKAVGWVAFSNGGTTITATIGEPFTPPTVSVTPNYATLHYTSSNPSVATVDANTGEVTLLKAGTTTITATFEGDNNYTGDYHYYNLTVVEQDLVIEPITKEVDYTMDGTDFLNADGTEKDLSNAVVNNILYTLKDQDSPEGDGYDPDLQSIVLNTEKSTAAVEKLIADGVEPGTREYAQNFTGITFLVPAGEGYIIITSQELNGANLMAKVGSNAPVAISMPQMGDYNIPYLSDHETWVYLWNGGQGGIESSRTRGRKTVANIRVQNVAYKARANAPDGILSVDVDDDDTDARWYNLRGQRIEKPKTKGLYIRNGQKVVVR